MRTIFNFINDILYHKKGDLLSNIEYEGQYNSYMVNRWISMYSPQHATLVNLTSNRLYPVLSTKELSYKFLLNVIPKSRPYRINYIKKTKSEKNAKSDAAEILANNLELSKREIRYYISSNNIDIERLKKTCQ